MLVHADAPPLSLASGGTDVLWGARIHTRWAALRLLFSASGGAGTHIHCCPSKNCQKRITAGYHPLPAGPPNHPADAPRPGRFLPVPCGPRRFPPVPTPVNSRKSLFLCGFCCLSGAAFIRQRTENQRPMDHPLSRLSSGIQESAF